MKTIAQSLKTPAIAAAYWQERSAYDAAYEAAQRVRELPRTVSLRMGRTTRAWARDKRREWLAAKARLRAKVEAG